MALREGNRGLPGGSCLAELLARHGVRTRTIFTRLTLNHILRLGGRPPRPDRHVAAGRIRSDCRRPRRNLDGDGSGLAERAARLAGGSSLARLLASRRGVRNRRPAAVGAVTNPQVGRHPSRANGQMAKLRVGAGGRCAGGDVEGRATGAGRGVARITRWRFAGPVPEKAPEGTGTGDRVATVAAHQATAAGDPCFIPRPSGTDDYWPRPSS